jgi:drug/metabolite transporter (DMT)-like permease
MNTWQRKVSATEAGLIYTTEPIFAAAYALFIPAMISQMAGLQYANEQLTKQTVIGGLFVLLANAWVQWKSKPHPPGIAPVP